MSRCGKFLWGMHEQGLQCQACRMVSCEDCSKDVVDGDCSYTLQQQYVPPLCCGMTPPALGSKLLHC